jgi:hypothetical protein
VPGGADRLSLLARVTTVLRERHIPFALVGAAALAVHGVSRSTRDLDLLAVARQCLDPTTWSALEAEGLTVTVRAGDATDPLGGVVRFAGAGSSPVDLVVGRSPWQVGVIERAASAAIEGVTVPVARPADLVLLKLYAGGAQDAWDIDQLLAAGPSDIAGQVEARLAELPDDARRLWDRIRDGREGARGAPGPRA